MAMVTAFNKELMWGTCITHQLNVHKISPFTFALFFFSFCVCVPQGRGQTWCLVRLQHGRGRPAWCSVPISLSLRGGRDVAGCPGSSRGLGGGDPGPPERPHSGAESKADYQTNKQWGEFLL